MTKLFKPDQVFISSLNNKEAIFKEVANKLLDEGLVKTDFFKNLVEREKQYPTGLDLSVISKNLPNIAIPHTESKFVNTKLIVPIKLIEAIPFCSMINPEKKINVQFLFMILNDDEHDQGNILSEIMDFVRQTPKRELLTFFESEDPKKIYSFLDGRFS